MADNVCSISEVRIQSNVLSSLSKTNDAEILARIASEYATRHINGFLSKYQLVTKLMESPIEAAFCCALAAEFHERAWALWQTTSICAHKDIRFNTADILLVPQYPVGRARVDLMILVRDVKPMRMYAIECDGAAYHDSNPQQVQRDRCRDRYLEDNGIRVRHYSGAEITANPIGKAVDALNFILNDAYSLGSRGES